MRGFALVQALLAVVAAAGLLLLSLQAVSYRLSLAERLKEDAAPLALQEFVERNIDCDAALYPSGGNCTDGAWLDVNDLVGNPLSHSSTGSVIVGERFALRFRCQQSPAPGLIAQYAESSNGTLGPWRDLFGGIPISCPAPSVTPILPGCTITDVSQKFNEAQIASAMGIASGDWMVGDDFHAHMACRRLGYSIFTTYTKANKTGCSGRKIQAWKKSAGAFAKVDACNLTPHMGSVTCRYHETGVCPCPAQKDLRQPGAINLAASHFANINFYDAGNVSYTCLAYPGSIMSPGGLRCPQIYNDAVNRTKICELFGYSTVAAFSGASNSSCSNNSVAKWNAGTNSYDLFPACSANKFIWSLKCSNPIAGACSNFY